MNWGKGIILSFIFFAVFIGILVTVCIREDINLVSRQYYEDELQYGEQMTKLQNTMALAEKPTIGIVGDSLRISYGDFSKINSAELKLFRPSNPAFDKAFEVPSGEKQVRMFYLGLSPKGMYKARMAWSMNGKEYFTEESLYYK